MGVKVSDIMLDLATGDASVHDAYIQEAMGQVKVSAAIYNATCSFATSQYTLVLPDSVSTPTANLFSLRFISSKDFVEGETFLFDGVTYSPVNADFKSGELLLVNFDKQNRKCYKTTNSLCLPWITTIRWA